MKGTYTGKPKVVDQEWAKRLLELDSFTALDAARIARECDVPFAYPADAIHRLRGSEDLDLIVLGPAGPSYHSHAKRYQLRRRQQ